MKSRLTEKPFPYGCKDNRIGNENECLFFIYEPATKQEPKKCQNAICYLLCKNVDEFNRARKNIMGGSILGIPPLLYSGFPLPCPLDSISGAELRAERKEMLADTQP